MKHFFKIFVSLYLSIILSLSVTLEAFAYSDTSEILDIPTISQFDTLSDSNNQKVYATEDEMKQDYDIISEMETSYGKIYYMKRKGIPQTRASFWDVVDIGMAVSSWAKLFGEPSWENGGWAILDTVSLLPFIPSLRYAKDANDAAKKIAEYAKKSTENTKRVVNSFKTGRETLKQVFKRVYFTRLVQFRNITIRRSQLEAKIYHAPELGIYLPGMREWDKNVWAKLKSYDRNIIYQKYKDEIEKIIRKHNGIFEGQLGYTPTYIFMYGDRAVHIRRDNFEFLSAMILKYEQKRLLETSMKIIPTNNIYTQFYR